VPTGSGSWATEVRHWSHADRIPYSYGAGFPWLPWIHRIGLERRHLDELVSWRAQLGFS
jgi:hypothetical protein